MGAGELRSSWIFDYRTGKNISKVLQMRFVERVRVTGGLSLINIC